MRVDGWRVAVRLALPDRGAMENRLETKVAKNGPVRFLVLKDKSAESLVFLNILALRFQNHECKELNLETKVLGTSSEMRAGRSAR